MREKKYLYQLKFEGGFPKIHYLPNTPIENDFLYKYYEFSERNVSALLSQKIYASYSDQLNDLFDSIYLNIQIEDSHIATFRKMSQFADFPFEEDKFKNSIDYREKLRNSFYAIWNSKIGVFSTTDSPANTLMWSHYTGNKGFVVKYRYKSFPANFGEPIPVSYLKLNEIQNKFEGELINQLLTNSLTKLDDWKYENEYRFLISPPANGSFQTQGRFSNENHNGYQKYSRLMKYSLECIHSIVLGFNFFKGLVNQKGTIDFGNPNGILKKTFIDFLFKNNIKIEVIKLDIEKMELIPRQFCLIKKSNLVYKLNYVR